MAIIDRVEIPTEPARRPVEAPQGHRRPTLARRLLRRDRIARAILVTLAAILVWALANVLGSPRIIGSSYGPAATSRYSILGVALLVPVLLAAAVAVHRVAFPRISRRAARRALVAGAVVAAFAVQMVIAFETARIPTSDSFVIISAALHAADPDVTPLIPVNDMDGYFSLYSNNIAPTAIFATVFRLAGLVGVTDVARLVLLALAVNALAMLAGGVLTLVAVRRLLGVRAMRVAIGPVVIFVVVSPWLNVPYTDSLAFPFPVALLLLAWWVASRTRRRSRILAWAGFGIVAGVGCAVKPTVVFAAVALGLYTLVRSARADRAAGSSPLRAVIGAAVGLTVTVGATEAFALFTDLTQVVGFSVFTNPNTLPFTHFMAMGAHGSGGYELSDVTRDAALSPTVRSGVDLQLFLDRVGAAGPVGYVLFLGRKLLFVLGDGAFYQGLDGYGPIIAFRTDPLATWVQQWYLLPGANHAVLSTVWQAAWLVLLLLAVVPGRRRATGTEAAVALAILLLLAFLLLSEARSRYLYIYLPFFIVLAASGAGRLDHLLRRRPWRARRSTSVAA